MNLTIPDCQSVTGVGEDRCTGTLPKKETGIGEADDV